MVNEFDMLNYLIQGGELLSQKLLQAPTQYFNARKKIAKNNSYLGELKRHKK